MPEKVANIAKNTSYFTLALIIQKVISFSYFTIYARVLGPEDLGKYYFAISFTSIAALFIDLGLANVLTREIAKTKEQAQKLLNNSLIIKVPLVALSWLVVFAVVNLWGYEDLVRDLVYIAAAVMVLDSFSSMFYATVRGFHNLKYESISAVVYQTVVLLFSLLVLHNHWDIRWLMVSLLLASFLNLVYSWLVSGFKYGLRLRWDWDWPLAKKLLLITVPFGLYVIFQKVYTFADSVILFKLIGDWAVGIYQIPFKIVMALQFLPAAFIASLYPAMSQYWKDNRQQLSVTFERAMNYSIIIALPITMGIMALSNKVVLLFADGYSQAVLPLRIVMISLFLMFLAQPVGALLNACDQPKKNTQNMAVVTVFSLVLNLILIPLWGVAGAAVTMTSSSLLLLLLGWRLVPQIIKYRWLVIAKVFVKALLAALFMGLFVYVGQNRLSLPLVVVVGAAIYGALLFLLGGFKKEDLRSILKSFKRAG